MCYGQILGGIGTAFATYQQGKSYIAAGKYNQKVYEAQASANASRAQRARQAGGIESTEAADRIRQTIAAGRAGYAANGLLLDAAPTDAPSLWEQDQAAMLAYEQAGIMDAAEMEAWGFRREASLDLSRAKWAKMSGYAQARSNGYANLASVLSQSGSAYSSYQSSQGAGHN